MFRSSSVNGMVNNNKEIMNNNKTMYLPSNLINEQNNSNNNKYLSFKFNVNNEYYILKIKNIESSSILFTCQKKDDITLLYEYSCWLSFQDLHNMNKNFLVCDNIDQIFNSIKTILTNHKEIAIPRIDFYQNNNNDALLFFFRSPLLSGQIEDTNIILQKTERNINSQFDKLVKKYENYVNFYQKIYQIIIGSQSSNDKIYQLRLLFNC